MLGTNEETESPAQEKWGSLNLEHVLLGWGSKGKRAWKELGVAGTTKD